MSRNMNYLHRGLLLVKQVDYSNFTVKKGIIISSLSVQENNRMNISLAYYNCTIFKLITVIRPSEKVLLPVS